MTPAAPPRAPLSREQADELGRRLDALRANVLESLDEDDAAYIRRIITLQRRLEVAGRALLLVGVLPPAWVAGTAALSVAKVLDNMEIGHNVVHGQWDWMCDPEIHSTTWEWDNASPIEEWKITHNYEHHTFTNVLGRDRDVGYDFMRVSELQEWKPRDLLQPLVYLTVATFFEQAIALHDIGLDHARSGEKPWSEIRRRARRTGRKIAEQAAKDYVFWPLVAGPSAVPMLLGGLTANVARNWWSNIIIMCGHFPDEVEVFTEDRLEGETKGEWYVRQMQGSGNITGSPLFHVMSGNLSHQIEHHLFPDVPSRRYAQIAPRVRALCEEYGLSYTTGRLSRQYGSFVRKMLRLSLPTPTPSPGAGPRPGDGAAPRGTGGTADVVPLTERREGRTVAA